MVENLLIGFTAMGICPSLQCIVASLLLLALFILERGGMVRHMMFGMTTGFLYSVLNVLMYRA